MVFSKLFRLCHFFNTIFSMHACKMKPNSIFVSRNLYKLIHLNNYGHNITKFSTLIPCLNWSHYLMVVDQSLDHLFVLANFLEVNQFLVVELIQLKKISITQGFAFYAQAVAEAFALHAQAFALHAQAFAVDAHALALHAQAFALYLPQSFQVFSTPSK